MMRGLLLLVGGGLGGADVQVSVDLTAIGVDDFPVELLGQLNRQPGLAGGGGPDDGYGGWFGGGQFMGIEVYLDTAEV